jgi:uncharacterized membrane protein
MQPEATEIQDPKNEAPKTSDGLVRLSMLRLVPYVLALASWVLSALVWDLEVFEESRRVLAGVVHFSGPLVLFFAAVAFDMARGRWWRLAHLGVVGSLMPLAFFLLLFGLHVAVLARVENLVRSLASAVIVVFAMFLGLMAFLVAVLEPSSALGIRVASSLRSEAAWRRIHRRAGLVLAAGSVASLFTLRFAADARWGALPLGLAMLGMLGVTLLADKPFTRIDDS